VVVTVVLPHFCIRFDSYLLEKMAFEKLFQPPKGWMDYPAVGSAIGAFRLLAFKVPLSKVCRLKLCANTLETIPEIPIAITGFPAKRAIHTRDTHRKR
jgi:hypothetical protein